MDDDGRQTTDDGRWRPTYPISSPMSLRLRWAKNRSRSQKPYQLFSMSQCYIHANLVEICQPIHEIWSTQALFWLKFGSLSPTVTLLIRSRSPKPNQLLIMSQCYIHAHLVKIHPRVHEIPCKQENVTLTPMLTLTPMGSAPKTICPPPLRWET